MFLDDQLPDPVDELPKDPAERAIALRNGLISHATDGSINERVYRILRKELMDDPATASLLPKFVRTCRDPSDFWGYIKEAHGTYAARRAEIRQAFVPLLDHLECPATPAAAHASEVLQSFDADGVLRVWDKALKRAATDPEGAITAARTLLESVCKHILDDGGGAERVYGGADDLPKLYRMVSEKLNIAPSQHTEDVFKRVLGGCSSIVEGLGSLRNKVGDAHGQGRRPVKVAPRHAHLAVNLAGTMATFLVETWAARSGSCVEAA